jgi:RNA polymerase sigma factor (sigma-70 family)
MAPGHMSGVLRHLRKLAGAPDPAEPDDAELLERFTTRRDGAAFADLVRRHGPMVQGVCRRILRNPHDADDAFQATFLILVRKAGAIARPGALAAWLHEVALRTALRARASAQLRRQHERQVPEMPQSDFLAAVAWRDLQPILDEEVRRLPAHYREPFVLCYLEGRTYEQTAERLRCLPGTVSRRLAKARELLRQRLTRRGLTLPAGVLTAALAEYATSAAVAGPLVTTTVEAALASAAGHAAAASAPVAALVEGGLRAMTLTKVKAVLGVLLAVGLACAGAGLLAQADPAPEPPPAAASKAALPAATARGGDKGKDAGGLVPVTGRVVGPGGRPVPGARVLVLDLPADIGRFQSEEDVHMEVKDRARGDAAGRFHVRVPRPATKRELPAVIAARADGYGLGLYPVSSVPGKGEVVIRLPRERVLRVRLMDLQGAPARDVAVRLLGVVEKRGESPVAAASPRGHVPGWFPPLRSDAQGRFTVRGVGPEQGVMLLVNDARYAPASLPLGEVFAKLEPGHTARGGDKEVVQILDPPRTLRGRVVYADTGEPAAGAVLTANGTRARAGADGRFRLSPRWAPSQDRVYVAAEPPPGPGGSPSPYLGWEAFLPAPKGPGVKVAEHTFPLPRGVVVSGKVVEAGSGKPVAGAGVCYFAPSKPAAQPDFFAGHPAAGLVHPVYTKRDGSFALAALPGSGMLLVKAARPDYVPVETSLRELTGGTAGGQRVYAHAVQPLDVKAGAARQAVTLTLRRGVTVKGRLVGPDGEPVAGAQLLSRLNTSTLTMGFVEARALPVPEAGFELGGCDLKKSYPAVFFHEKRGLGAVVVLPGKQDAGPLTVRLEPCGKATVRFVNAAGEPVEGHWPEVEVVLTGGPSWADPKAAMKGLRAADTVNLANLYRGSYQLTDFRTDDKGRITLPNLVPGATYRITSTGPGGPRVREFTVRAGETRDLGDIVLGRAK